MRSATGRHAFAAALALVLAGCGLFDGAPVHDAALSVPCGEAECPFGLDCCGDLCVNLRNDVANCGACGTSCSGALPYCAAGACAQTPCNPATVCSRLCCGSSCCAAGQVCCELNRGGARLEPDCVTPGPTGSCPTSCPLCR